jgi:hypothetical protein
MKKLKPIKMDYIELRVCDWLDYLKNFGHSEHTPNSPFLILSKGIPIKPILKGSLNQAGSTSLNLILSDNIKLVL